MSGRTLPSPSNSTSHFTHTSFLHLPLFGSISSFLIHPLSLTLLWPLRFQPPPLLPPPLPFSLPFPHFLPPLLPPPLPLISYLHLTLYHHLLHYYHHHHHCLLPYLYLTLYLHHYHHCLLSWFTYTLPLPSSLPLPHFISHLHYYHHLSRTFTSLRTPPQTLQVDLYSYICLPSPIPSTSNSLNNHVFLYLILHLYHLTLYHLPGVHFS